MKVALVFDGLGFGGIERVGIHYARLFLKMGYEIDIYNLKPDCTELEKEFPKECRILHKKMPDLILPDRYMLMVKRWSWGKYLYPWLYAGTSALMYLYRLFGGKRKRYDIAIAFAGHFRDLTFVANRFILADKKLCWLHGALMEYLASSCTYGDLYRKIKNLCVLSVDRQESALFANRYLYGLNIRQLYNPIPTEPEELDEKLRRELKEKYGDYLLMVGRFETDKDQKTVLAARKILQEKYNQKPKLVFVGGGSTLEDCKAYAAKLGLSEDVIFMGARYDVANFYTTAYISLHSSPAEGLPTVLLEAMKYGVPVVATDSPPGVTEILKNDRYGLRCGVADPEDMAEKIHQLLEDDKKREYYIAQGKKRLSDFSYETIEKKLGEILEGLL